MGPVVALTLGLLALAVATLIALEAWIVTRRRRSGVDLGRDIQGRRARRRR